MKHSPFRVLLLLGTILLVAIAGVLIYLGRPGSNPLQAWIGEQLIAIVNSKLNPQLSFDGLDYTYPKTVSVKNLRLSAPDPARPGEMLDMLGADSATITLDKIPRLHKPIKIAKIVLDGPVCRLVSIKPGGSDLIGFSNMVKPDATSAPATQNGGDQPFKLSDVLLIRLVQLNNGKVIYDPRLRGTEPMVFDHINTQIDVVPRSDGAYQLKLALDRQPLFNLTTVATLNIDTFVMTDIDALLSANIGGDRNNYLPPQLQRLIVQHEARGALRAHVTGILPLTSPGDAVATVDATLVNANVRTGAYRIPISRLQLSAGLRDHLATLASLDLDALRGNLTASAFYHFDDARDTDIRLHIRDMMIEDLFATSTTSATDAGTKFAGRVRADALMDVSLAALLERFGHAPPASMPGVEPGTISALPNQWGEGAIHIDHGRIVSLPVIREIAAALQAATHLIGVSRDNRPRETVDASFALMGDQVKVTRFDMVGELIAGRGRGLISLDKRLDCIVNGGPVEKVQLLFGQAIGGFFGDITDRLYAYHVTGTISKPQIGVLLPGSSIIGKVGAGMQDAGSGIFGGVKRLFGQ